MPRCSQAGMSYSVGRRCSIRKSRTTRFSFRTRRVRVDSHAGVAQQDNNVTKESPRPLSPLAGIRSSEQLSFCMIIQSKPSPNTTSILDCVHPTPVGSSTIPCVCDQTYKIENILVSINKALYCVTHNPVPHVRLSNAEINWYRRGQLRPVGYSCPRN